MIEPTTLEELVVQDINEGLRPAFEIGLGVLVALMVLAAIVARVLPDNRTTATDRIPA